jgi:6-phosphogluconate dehydrogenase
VEGSQNDRLAAYDALVVGSGPSASAIAGGLAAAGRRVLVLPGSGVPKPPEVPAGPGVVCVADSVSEALASLKTPRRVLLAPAAHEDVEVLLRPVCARLEPTDMVGDLSESFFREAEQRASLVASTGQRYVGLAVLASRTGGDSVYLASGHRAGYEGMKQLLFGATGEDGGLMPFMGGGGAAHMVKTAHETLLDCQVQSLVEACRVLAARTRVGPKDLAAEVGAWADVAEGGQTPGWWEQWSGEGLRMVPPPGVQSAAWANWARQTAMQFSIAVPSLVAAAQARVLRTAYVGAGASAGADATTPAGLEGYAKRCQEALAAAGAAQVVQGLALVSGVSEGLHFGTDVTTVASGWHKAGLLSPQPLTAARDGLLRGLRGTDLVHAEPVAGLLRSSVGSLRLLLIDAIQVGSPCPVLTSSLVYLDSLALLAGKNVCGTAPC